MLWVSEGSYIGRRLSLLRLAVIYTYQQEVAYFANNWTSLLSTLVFTVSYVLFINVLFATTRTFAGYSRTEMLFFAFVAQIQYYTITAFSAENLDKLTDDVNTGALDLTLSRPLPALFYLTTRSISTVGLLRNGLIPVAFIALAIRWSQLGLTPVRVAVGVLIFILGQVAFHTFQFLLALPAFWIGKSKDIYYLWYSLSEVDIPYEGLPQAARLLFTTLIPTIVSTSLCVSAFLGKSDPFILLGMSAAIAAGALAVRAAAWRLALRSYTSASS